MELSNEIVQAMFTKIETLTAKVNTLLQKESLLDSEEEKYQMMQCDWRTIGLTDEECNAITEDLREGDEGALVPSTCRFVLKWLWHQAKKDKKSLFYQDVLEKFDLWYAGGDFSDPVDCEHMLQDCDTCKDLAEKF